MCLGTSYYCPTSKSWTNAGIYICMIHATPLWHQRQWSGAGTHHTHHPRIVPSRVRFPVAASLLWLFFSLKKHETKSILLVTVTILHTVTTREYQAHRDCLEARTVIRRLLLSLLISFAIALFIRAMYRKSFSSGERGGKSCCL